MQVSQLNEQTIIIKWSEQLDPETLHTVLAYRDSPDWNAIEGILEVWNTFNSLAVRFDPLTIHFTELKRSIQNLRPLPTNNTPNNTVIIEVNYLPKSKDMQLLSKLLQLTPTEIIAAHQEPEYTVGMIGFLPGFPYLLGLPEVLHSPRKNHPEFAIPKGAVAIGGAQAGIYPQKSPGGWYVLGITDMELFEGTEATLNVGDKVRFQSL